MIDPRILNRASGYWPNSPLTGHAVKAWEHLLDSQDPAAVLDALDDYAAEGHTRPPVAGQLRKRLDVPTPTGTRETEVERCARQRADAQQKLRDGRMTKADFGFYESDYWSLHIEPLSNPSAA